MESGASVVLVSPEERSHYVRIINVLQGGCFCTLGLSVLYHVGKDMPQFPVDAAFLPAIRARVSLAQQIYKARTKSQKVCHETSFVWIDGVG